MKKNIAVLGAGYWGQNLIRNFFELGVLKYVYDEDDNVQNSFIEKYQLSNASLSDILDDVEIDGIVIVTPAETHFSIAKHALERGKDVFVEKPITLDISEAKELINIAEKNNRILMVGHLLQYHSHFIKLKKYICEKKEIPTRISSYRKSLGKVRDNENVIWSFAPHDISMINSIIPGEIIEIEKVSRKYFNENIDSSTMTFIKGSEKVRVDLEVDWAEIEKIQRIAVYFSDEIIVFEDSQPDPEKKLYKLKIPFTKTNLMQKNSNKREYIDVEANNPLKNECLNFLNSIKTRKKPITDGNEALEVLKFLIQLDNV